MTDDTIDTEIPARPIDRWFAHYSDDHRNHANQRLHVICVPLILWSVIALLWTIPSPASLFNDGVFVAAWIAQFVGHKLEGRKPSFLTDLTYLLIGPAWVLAKLYRKLGWRY